MLSLPHIQQAIRKEAEDLLNANVGLAAKVLVELATTSKSDAVRLQAAVALLDRGGLPFIRQSEHTHRVEDHRSDAELKQHILKLTSELGLNAKVIEQAPQPIEPTPASIEHEPATAIEHAPSNDPAAEAEAAPLSTLTADK